MRIGAVDLLDKYGTRMNVAIALILGKIQKHEEYFVKDLIDPTMVAAAEAVIRLELVSNHTNEKKND